MKRIRIAALTVLLLMLAGCSAGPELSFSESNAVAETDTEMAATEAEEISVAEDLASQPVKEGADASQEKREKFSVSIPADDDSANEPDVPVNVSENVPANDRVLPADALNNALKNAYKNADATVNSEEPEPAAAEAPESVSQPVMPEESEPVVTTKSSPSLEAETPSEPKLPSEPESIAEPAPEPEPEPVPEPEPSFDIAYWISYARGVATSKGLNLDSSAVDCWDNPITANPDCIYLERDISARLSRYAGDEDITDVWIWYECVGTNKYLIYIGYA